MAYDSSKVSEAFLVYSEDKVTVSRDFPNLTTACLSLSPLCTAPLELWGSPAALLGGLYPLPALPQCYTFHLFTVSLWQNHLQPLGLA